MEETRTLLERRFKAAIDAGVATIMTAHVFVPSLDDQRPATLSSRIASAPSMRSFSTSQLGRLTRLSLSIRTPATSS